MLKGEQLGDKILVRGLAWHQWSQYGFNAHARGLQEVARHFDITRANKACYFKALSRQTPSDLPQTFMSFAKDSICLISVKYVTTELSEKLKSINFTTFQLYAQLYAQCNAVLIVQVI